MPELMRKTNLESIRIKMTQLIPGNGVIRRNIGQAPSLDWHQGDWVAAHWEANYCSFLRWSILKSPPRTPNWWNTFKPSLRDRSCFLLSPPPITKKTGALYFCNKFNFAIHNKILHMYRLTNYQRLFHLPLPHLAVCRKRYERLVRVVLNRSQCDHRTVEE